MRESIGRYTVTGTLGEGGMGVVHLCKDAWIGREVAMKVVRERPGIDRASLLRFVREARVQGQLEHPSIVPVYDIGSRQDGAAFFTMRRVKGVTLGEIIEGLSRRDPGITALYGRRKLLGAMTQVCNAVAFAHSRGVVHRDLKPDNVMLGDYGEVYVLDWGIARTAGTPEIDGQPSAGGTHGDSVQTAAGAVLGTPGYAAPEQVRGENDAIGPHSDVYALGATLFELLALEPLHRAGSLHELLTSTLSAADARPSARRPGSEIAPELDAICSRATALDPGARFSSARELGDAIERHLGGERDAEHRRGLARRHVVQAQLALALAARGGADAEQQRARGLRELGAALALEPTNQGALGALMQALLDVPETLPPAAEAELREVNRRDRAEAARAGSFGYLLVALTLPLVLLLGVRSWAWLALLEASVVAAAAYSYWMWKSGRALPRYMVWMLPLNFVQCGLFSMFFGPFVIVPGAAAVTAAAFMVGIRANRTTRRGIALLALGAVLLPAALQLTGVVAPSYAMEGGVLEILPHAVEFPAGATLALLALSAVLTVLTSVLMVGRAVEALVEAERRNFAQAFRLRQLLPEAGAGS